MVKLDYQKWRAELDAAMEKKDAATVTRLHIIRAQIRGKQHRQRARLDWVTASVKLKKMSFEEALKLAANGGTTIVPLTHQDEATLLGDTWKQYVVEIGTPAFKMVTPKQEKEETFLQAFRRWLLGPY